jgi:hypothetical protein
MRRDMAVLEAQEISSGVYSVRGIGKNRVERSAESYTKGSRVGESDFAGDHQPGVI